jgi:hypothetical protein
MAIAIVGAQTTMNNSATTTVVGTYAGTPTTGSLLLAGVAVAGTGSHPTVADSNGSWTEIIFNQDGVSTRSAALFGKIAVASQPTVITATRASATLMYINLYEFTGASTLFTTGAQTPLDGSGTSTGACNVTTTDAGSLLMAAAFTSGTITSVTESGAYTMSQSNAVGAIRFIDAYYLPGATGTYTPTFAWTTSRNYAEVNVEFFPAAAAGTEDPFPFVGGGYFPVAG